MKIKVTFQDAENGFWLNDYVIEVEPEPLPFGWSRSLQLNFPPFHMILPCGYLEAKENGEI